MNDKHIEISLEEWERMREHTAKLELEHAVMREALEIIGGTVIDDAPAKIAREALKKVEK